jgi:hypothetical protein
MRGVALYLLLLTLAACATPGAGVSPERFARFFDELTYGNPATPEGETPTLVRWTGPRIVYAVAGEHSTSDDQRIADVAGRFSGLTGIEIRRGEASEAQLTIGFTKAQLLGAHDELGRCVTRWRTSGSAVIRAEILVNTERVGSLDECLDHELMHALGFRHHSGIMPSVMSPFAPSGTLTVADRVALRILYDPKLTPGIGRDQAWPLVMTAFGGHRAEFGVVASAGESQSAALDLEWQAVPAGDATLAFAPPGLPHAVEHHYRAIAADRGVRIEISLWSAPAATRPRAGVRAAILDSNHRFRTTLTLTDASKLWTLISEQRVVGVEQRSYVNAVGTSHYAIVSTPDGPCMLFVQELRNVASTRFDGFYCGAKDGRIEDADAHAILDTVSLRSLGTG